MELPHPTGRDRSLYFIEWGDVVGGTCRSGAAIPASCQFSIQWMAGSGDLEIKFAVKPKIVDAANPEGVANIRNSAVRSLFAGS